VIRSFLVSFLRYVSVPLALASVVLLFGPAPFFAKVAGLAGATLVAFVAYVVQWRVIERRENLAGRARTDPSTNSNSPRRRFRALGEEREGVDD